MGSSSQMSGGTRPSTPDQAGATFDKLFAIQPIANDAVCVTFLSDAANLKHEGQLREILTHLHHSLKAEPALKRLVLDVTNLNNFPDEARGALAGLLVSFAKRGGTTICGMHENMRAMLKFAHFDSLYSEAQTATLPKATSDCERVFDELTVSVEGQRLVEAAKPPPTSTPTEQLRYNGKFMSYSISNGTAIMTLNREISRLPEENYISEALQEAIAQVGIDPEVNRVLLNLNGVHHLGSCAIGALIVVNNSGRSGKGPHFALACVDEHMKGVFKITRLDRVLRIFERVEEGVASVW